MFATLFKFTGVAYKKGPCILIFVFQSNFPPKNGAHLQGPISGKTWPSPGYLILAFD